MLAAALVGGGIGTVPAAPHYFEQRVDHFSAASDTFSQRYYMNASAFGGPGHPIVLIVGGEGAIPPTTGFFYPYVVHSLAPRLKALVIEPEHRFYGESLPTGAATTAYNETMLHLLTPQQALADTVTLLLATQTAHGCTARGTAGYCPIVTIGGSYPGWLSAMLRLRYPSVVDGAWAASAPIRLYAQEVGQFDYSAVAFAGLNMGNYPPTADRALAKACRTFTGHPKGSSWWPTLRGFLHGGSGCFNLSRTLPARATDGGAPTFSCADWSGCGGGFNGLAWDYESCSYLVVKLGLDGTMFPARRWTLDWLTTHCRERFGIQPRPDELVGLWGFGAAGLRAQGASRIVFTNGLNDGWSAGGFASDVDAARELLVLNMPNGAHHSDLSHAWPMAGETADVLEVRANATALLEKWVGEVRSTTVVERR